MKLNKKQKVALLIGAVLFLIPCLYPPVAARKPIYGMNAYSRRTGRCFVLPQGYRLLGRIDVRRLASEWVLVVAVTSGAVLLLRNRPTPKKPPEPEDE